jgi:Sperm-tail PG-rich repeat
MKKPEIKGPKYSMPSKPAPSQPPLVPGPGTYNAERLKSAGRSKASIKFGTEAKLPEDQTTVKLVPGPGTYKLKPDLSQIGGAIGNEPKFPTDKTTRKIVPGPGAYGQKDTLEKTGTKFGHETRIKYEMNPVPGPGQYPIPSGFGGRK